MARGTEVAARANVESNANKSLYAVIGLVFLIGISFWIKQITAGYSGYSDQFAWGLYIAAFFTAVAGGAGIMILIAITQMMNRMEQNNSKQLYTVAIAMFVMAGFFILADLGSPLNIVNLLFTSNASAPMVLDFWLLLACVIICLLALFLKEQKKSLSIIALVFAVALLAVESWLVASSSVQQLWGTTLGGGIAYIQVAIMAFALVMLIGQNSRYLKTGLIFSLVLFLVVSLAELLAGLSDSGRLGMQWVAVSKSGLFWSGIVLGVLAPLALSAVVKQTGKISVIVTSALAILGVLLTKLSYVWASQAIPAIEARTLNTIGFQIEEIIVLIGFSALGILVYKVLNARKGGALS